MYQGRSFRYAHEADINLIRSMALQVWPLSYSHILTTDQINYMLDMMYNEKALAEQMQNDHFFIIVFDKEEPVGFASFSEIEPSIYKLHKIYILASQQGKGTGKYAMDQISKEIKEKGGTLLRLNVNRQNKARIFYEKLGFRIMKSEDIDIGNGYYMNDYIMEKKLDQQ